MFHYDTILIQKVKKTIKFYCFFAKKRMFLCAF